ncbi:MAG TPA: helix-turn-helix domain-containing protein [Streptosporangiaceae bacterium]|nr:helix-turn-helix domain-containing protein [Streptosporangiaceae bacterium]
MRALLVLSILMTESPDDEQILRLATSAAASLGSWQISGFVIGNAWWADGHRRAAVEPELAAQLRALPETGGPVTLDAAWAWAYPLRSIAGRLGYLVVHAAREPAVEEQFLAQVLAQQTGVAVSNAQLHGRERDTAAQLAATNEALEETVATLRRGMAIHERLTGVAAAGEGAAGIAAALHDLTGLAVAVEDRYGNLSGWAGPGQPARYPKPPPYDREQLLRRLMAAGRSVRDGDRVVALASPRPGVLGLLSLVDPGHRAGTTDIMALEQGATVLAVELARLRGMADTELRVRRELVQDLLTGTDDESAYRRAEALGYDLGQPHQVAVVEMPGGGPATEDPLHATRRAVRQHQLPCLLGTLSGTVVIVAAAGRHDWVALRAGIVAGLDGSRCRMGVGDPCPQPSQLPRSLREARLALRLQKASATAARTSVYADLDVLRMLAAVDDLSDVAGFVRKWLGALVAYDERKHTELVKTLTQYLQHGGGYEATSRALSVHRSTLKYRLQRIRELTGFDLGDPEIHFNLQLATRAHATLLALGDEGG